MRRFRNHGITSDHRQRESAGSWFYEMTELGYNYRLTDVQCALGISQLRKLGPWTARRNEIARRYDAGLSGRTDVTPLRVRPDVLHAYHLYVVRLALPTLSANRSQVFRALRAEGVGVNVHYVPVHLHPYYRQRFGHDKGMCPVAEAAYEAMLSLPIFPTMLDTDVDDCLAALDKVLKAYAR
jgi:perosamine synthetase